MNLPNWITMLRVALIPFFVYSYGRHPYATLIIFVVASLSDFADGYIARKYKLITNFGKLMDPLADKLLVSAALILMAGTAVPFWAVVVLISREFYISGVRQLALEQKLVMSASMWGKAKTMVQMIMIIFLLIPLPAMEMDMYRIFDVIRLVLIYASVLLSVISAVDYSVKNRKVFGKLR